MTIPFIDTDAIVRLLTRDDPEKQAAVTGLFEEVERGTLTPAAPVTVIADAVYVLSSLNLYRLPRNQVSALLMPLVRLPGFRLADRRWVLRALELYGTTNLGFGDAMIVASMEQAGSTSVYSYDRHFDAISGIVRLEPDTPSATRPDTGSDPTTRPGPV